MIMCECFFWKIGVFGVFLAFFANFATIRKLFSRNLSARIVHVLDATFMPNLTFLGLLSFEISFGEKNSHPLRHPHGFFRHSRSSEK